MDQLIFYSGFMHTTRAARAEPFLTELLTSNFTFLVLSFPSAATEFEGAAVFSCLMMGLSGSGIGKTVLLLKIMRWTPP
jgi:hypothetical protein